MPSDPSVSGSGTVSRCPARMTRSAPAEVGAGDDRVTVADQLQLRDCAEGMFHGVGQPLFVAGHAVDVDQGGGQQGNVLAQVQAGGASDRRGGGSAVTVPLYHCLPAPALTAF